MFGNYQFSNSNTESLNLLLKNLENAPLKSNKYSLWSSCFLDPSLFANEDISRAASSQNHLLSINREAKLDSNDQAEVIDVVCVSDSEDDHSEPTVIACSSDGEVAASQHKRAKQRKLDLSQTTGDASQASVTTGPLCENEIPVLLQEIQDDVLELKDCLSCNSDANVVNSDFLNALDAEKMKALLKFLQAEIFTDSAFCLMCSFLENNISYDCGIIFVDICVIPMIFSKKQIASRQLMNALAKLFTSYPFLCIHLLSEIILKMPTQSHSPVLIDLCVKIIKEMLSISGARTVFSNALNKVQGTLNEDHTVIMQALQDKHSEIAEDDLQLLILLLTKSKDVLSKSLKFAKFVLNLIQKHGKKCGVNEVQGLQSIADANKTFLKRSMEKNLSREE